MKTTGKITLEHAQELLKQYTGTVECERVPVLECSGRILAENVQALVSHPAFARSAMDGYALRSEDVEGASRSTPVVLYVSDKICAGGISKIRVSSGMAVRIMTGAMIPDGADCVIRQEDTDLGEPVVRIYASAEARQFCCMEGEDFLKDEILARQGERIDAYLISAAVAAGRKELLVRKRIRAAVITTGDELKQPGSVLKRGQIYDAGLAYLQVRLLEMGCLISCAQAVTDDTKDICRAVAEAAGNADIVITTGGVSVGEKDLLPYAMEELGGETLFHGMDIKPGMPTMFSMLGAIPVLSLSGNPYSAFAVFELLMPVLMSTMQSRKTDRLRERTAIAADAFPKKSRCRRIIRAVYDGENVRFLAKQRNGQLTGGIGTNCLVDIPAGAPGVYVGDKVKILLLDN